MHELTRLDFDCFVTRLALPRLVSDSTRALVYIILNLYESKLLASFLWCSSLDPWGPLRGNGRGEVSSGPLSIRNRPSPISPTIEQRSLLSANLPVRSDCSTRRS